MNQKILLRKLSIYTWSMCVPTIKIGALGAWEFIELSQKSKPAYSAPNLTFLENYDISIKNKFLI